MALTLLDVILQNFEDGSAEKAFADIVSEDYLNRFDADDFDLKFSAVGGYPPIKTAALRVAENYLDESDIVGSDKDEAMKAFSEAYDDVANKATINIHAIMDGIVDEFEDIDEEEDDPENSSLIEDIDDDDDYGDEDIDDD